MHRKTYKTLIVVLSVLIVLLLAVIAYIGSILMNAPKDAEIFGSDLPAATVTPKLLTSQDFEPDRSVLFSFPQGTMTDGQGQHVTLASFRGRPTVLIFWSSWCSDCKGYLTEHFVQAAQTARSSGAAVHLVCREGVKGDNREAAEAALKQLGLTESTLMDPDAALYQAMGLRWVPSVAILNAQGRLVYTGKNAPDAAGMAALIRYAQAPADQTLRFVESSLSTSAGLAASGYRVRNDRVIPGNTLLSETQGLLMLYAAQTGNQDSFDRVWYAVRDNMSAGGLTAWRVEKGKRADVNASLDDLRIIEALALADARWGMYGYEAAARAKTLYDRCVRDGLMRDFASLSDDTIAETVTLCYMDVAAMRSAAAYDPRWADTAEKAQTILGQRESLISEALPLYHTRYDVKKQICTGDTVQMNEACVAVLNAARAGVAQPETLDWLENALASGPVYAKYGADGKAVTGYKYESNATYALLAQIGAAADRERMTQLALERMERRRSFDGAMEGGYGKMSAVDYFIFDELEAMLAWAALETAK